MGVPSQEPRRVDQRKSTGQAALPSWVDQNVDSADMWGNADPPKAKNNAWESNLQDGSGVGTHPFQSGGSCSNPDASQFIGSLSQKKPKKHLPFPLTMSDYRTTRSHKIHTGSLQIRCFHSRNVDSWSRSSSKTRWLLRGRLFKNQLETGGDEYQ